MKRFISLLTLVLLAGIVACETSEPGLISGPQLKPDKGDLPDKATPLIAAFRDAETDKIRSDDRGPYVDRSCGVLAEIARGTSTAWFFPSGLPIKGNEKDCGEPRRYNILLPDGSSVTGMVVVDGIRQVTEETGPQLHWAAFKSELCPFRFDNWDGLEGDPVQITRFDNETWWIESTNQHRAVCTTEFGSTVHYLPFKLTFTLK